MNKLPKLLLIGSSNGNTHLSNYYELIKNEFDEIHVITNQNLHTKMKISPLPYPQVIQVYLKI